MAWKRLIRFVDDNDFESFGDPCIDSADELYNLLEAGSLFAIQYTGATPTGPLVRGERTHVKALRDLFRSADVPIVRCIGLNYMKHIKEGGRTPPPYPSVFIKPSTTVAGHDEDVPIPKVAQDGTVDYEGELAVVIGDRPVKNLDDTAAVSDEEVLSYVAGYCVANDVSARAWQRDPSKAGTVPQWCFSKGFDKYAPLGPMLVAPSTLKQSDEGISVTATTAATTLTLQTFVNGEERQNTSTGDLLFGVVPIVRFCSQGTTLQPGTVILTGTPSGVAMGMKPPRYLEDGDVVEVRISQLGRVRNKMVFE